MAGSKMEMDPDVLRSTAKKIENSAADMGKELKRFQAVIEGLSSTWSSEVKDRFLQNYQKDRAALAEMAAQYADPGGCKGIRIAKAQSTQKSGIKGVRFNRR